MKKLVFCFMILMLLVGCGSEAETDFESESHLKIEETQQEADVVSDYKVLNYDDMKAIWLSQYDLNGIYMLEGQQRPEHSFRELLAVVLNNVKNNGFNTIIVQVRPNADSMYPSTYYPPSNYVVGFYGNEMVYDPFEILIHEAHDLGLSVHAWINPLRAMSVTNIELVDDSYAISQWYRDDAKNGTYIVSVGNNYYLNPAYEDVRQLIINGAMEIAQTYDIDGLHMDDYFYPTQETEFDQEVFDAYQSNGGILSQSDYRREQFNILVSAIYSTVKSVNTDILFGISPAGNIDNVYDTQYADVYTWCSQSGYIDYICPQVYFGMEHETYDFVQVCKTWESIIKNENIDLIIGMTLGKAEAGFDQYAGTGQDEWANNKDVLKRSLETTLNLEKCRGVSVFSYLYFYNPVSGIPAEATQQERDNFIPLLKEITWQ